jgi:site-specific DNA recombinase
MRVATYTRISTDEENQPYSLGAQRDRLDAYAKSQGWKIVRRFSDQASGAKTDRAGLQQALAEANASRFDLVLVYRVDRLRSVRGLAHVIEELDRAGVLFRSATEPFDTASPAGRMMVQMLGVFAEFERASIIERVIAAQEKKAARGEWNGGHIPLGYRLDPATKSLVPKPAEARIVEDVFHRYVERLEGSVTIAEWLSDRGYRTRSGKVFSAKGILTILRNRAYLGEVHYRRANYDGQHDALISENLFNRAQAILTERGEDHSLRRSNQSDYLLTGLVRCARCGKRYVGAAAHGRNKRYRYYVCNTRHTYRAEECDAERLPADELDTAITEQLVSVLEHEPLVRQAITEAMAQIESERPRREYDRVQLDGEIRRTNDALDRYYVAFEEGTLTLEDCAPRIKELQAQKHGLEAHREQLSLDDVEAPESLSEDELLALAADVAEIMQNGDDRQKKALFQALVSEIRVVGRDEIYPSFQIPVRPPSGSVAPGGVEPPHADSKSAALIR